MSQTVAKKKTEFGVLMGHETELKSNRETEI